MTTPERRYLDPLAESYLDSFWQSRFGDFDAALEDLAAEFRAAVTDRWVEWKERVNVGTTTPPAGGSRSDSPLRAVVEVPVREFDFNDVAEMQEEMEQAKEGRDA